MSTYKPWPVTFVSGEGARLRDDSGKEYLDFAGGIAVASVGHAHPSVSAAIAEQARSLIHVSNLYGTVPQRQLAERLAALTGGMHSFFCNSGAESIEAAVKLARRWAGGAKPGAYRIVATAGGFHGRTMGALAATGQPAKQEPFQPMLTGFTHAPYGDVAALSSLVGDDTAAVLLEPIQGENGVIVPPKGYLAQVRALCDETNTLLILDEVQTGLGRTGAWFAHQHSAATPDVMCLAKALAGGLPMGACLARPEVAAAFRVGDHATTFGGGPVQSAAALAVLDVIESEGLVENAAEMGERLMKGLDVLFGDVAEVRGLGLLVGVDFGRDVAREISGAALARGLLVNDVTASTVRLSPPLVITDADVTEALDVLEEVWREVAAA